MTFLTYDCPIVLSLIVFTYAVQFESLQEIPALQKNNTFIRNEHDLLNKINKIIDGGHSHLQIITDFDRTLTADSSDTGKKVLNSFGSFRTSNEEGSVQYYSSTFIVDDDVVEYELLRLCPSIPSYTKNEDKLFKTYFPVVSDPNLSKEEKTRYLKEWFTASSAALKGLKFPEEDIKALVRNNSQAFRDGVNELISWSKANNVPILVVSSGLGNSVIAYLEAANLFSSTIKVISNFVATDNNDIVIGYKGNTVYDFNKQEAVAEYMKNNEKARDRSNVILMGDVIDDANATNGINFNAIIKIGFLSNKQKANNQLQTYLNNFDIVLVNEQTMDLVNALLNAIVL